jgi:hypothetical protein
VSVARPGLLWVFKFAWAYRVVVRDPNFRVENEHDCGFKLMETSARYVVDVSPSISSSGRHGRIAAAAAKSNTRQGSTSKLSTLTRRTFLAGLHMQG